MFLIHLKKYVLSQYKIIDIIINTSNLELQNMLLHILSHLFIYSFLGSISFVGDNQHWHRFCLHSLLRAARPGLLLVHARHTRQGARHYGNRRRVRVRLQKDVCAAMRQVQMLIWYCPPRSLGRYAWRISGHELDMACAFGMSSEAPQCD